MTTTESDAQKIVDEATEIIDNALKEISQRDLVSSSEMRDTLLDIRNLFSAQSGSGK
jgi:hypothetical protein